MNIQPITSLKGTIEIPPDKSISHRSVMFASLAKGTSHITNFLMGEDCLSTIRCFRALGVPIQIEGHHVIIKGKGLHGLSRPDDILDCGNSGTTVRLISGILSGQTFQTTLTGDASIQKRPMQRIIKPLTEMGATFKATNEQFCPMTIYPNTLKGITYHSPIASAQVKSAILLAGLYAHQPTTVIEPALSRDHTERMLSAFGATLERQDTAVTISPTSELYATDIIVPGDISSAAFFIVASLITPHSELIIQNVGCNPTRSGLLDVLCQMGGTITRLNEREVGGEPICDLHVCYSELHGVTIEGDIIPTLIDEIPALAIAALFAEGETIIRDASELRVKESDRIEALYQELSKMGAKIQTKPDGMIISGGYPLHGALLESHEDHRIAMSLAIAALRALSSSTLLNPECVSISFPNFWSLLASHCQ